MKNNNWIRPLTYALIIFIGPLLAYYLIYVQAREAALLDRAYSHLTNITTRTEARINNVFTVIGSACTSPYNFRNAINKNELGLSTKKAGWDECLNVKNNAFDTSRNIEITSRERLKISYGKIEVIANTKELVGTLDLSDRFHDIFIFNQDEKIIYQKYPEQGRIEKLTELFDTSKATTEKNPLIKDPLNSLRVSYRGRMYLMPTQPLQIDFNEAGKESWLMVGLIEESQFNAEKLKFQADTVAWTVLLIATLVLIGPFLKIWYLGRFESLKKIDVVLLIGAGFTLCSLLTLVVIQFNVRTGLNSFMESRLKSISGQMVDDVNREIRQSIQELEVAEREMRGIFNALSDSEYNEFQNCTFEAKQDRQDKCNSLNWTGNLLANGIPTYFPSMYPFFNMAYLMSEEGCQVVKWSTRPQPTNVGCFGDRAYFLRSLPNKKLPLNLYNFGKNRVEDTDSVSEAPTNFFIEFITSRTTGERSIAISIPIKAEKQDGEGASPRDLCLQSTSSRPTPCVAVMTSSSLRALEPVLPYGFGFALVDKKGALLAHHEGNANTELNLIDELADGALLKAALYSGSDEYFSSDYRNTLHHFLVKPLNINGADYSLVTFYSQDTVLMPLLESSGTTMVTWLIWFTLLFSLALTIWQWNKFLEGGLFSKIGHALKRFDLALLISTTVVIIATFFWPLVALIAPLYVVPVLLIWLFKVSNNFRTRPFTVVAISWILMLSATSLPVLGMFKLIHGEAFAGFMQLHLAEYDESLEKQRNIIRNWVANREILRDDLSYANFEKSNYSDENTYAQFWRRYPLFSGCDLQDIDCDEPFLKENDFHTSQQTPGTTNVWHNMLGRLPDYSDDTIQLHAMYRSPKWLMVGDNTLKSRDAGNQILSSMLKVSNNGLAVLLSVIFLVILGVALWYVLVRTLGLRTENFLRLLNFQLPEKNSGARELIYGLGEASKIEFFKPADQRRISKVDLRLLLREEVIKTLTGILEFADNTTGAAQDIVVLDHFDDSFIDRDVVMDRIKILELLIKHPSISVVILLATDPLSFVTATFDADKDAALIARLSSALAQFNVSYFQESAPKLLGVNKEDRALREECYHPNLRNIYLSIHEQSSQKHLDTNEIIQLVKSRANAIYQQMWNLCTRAEKIMLIELAHENLVNPNNWDIARRLKQRGYLRRDPFHRIFNESFKQFILRMERVENIELWRKEGASTWHNIRAPLFVLVIGAIIFLAVTQPSFFNSVFAFAAAGTASLPFLVNLIMAKLKSGVDK